MDEWLMPRFNITEGGMHDRFLHSRRKIQILGGGYGNGKTATCCVKGVGFAYDYPGSNGLIARSTYPKLNDTIRREFFKWCPKDHIKRWPTKDDNTLILKNDTTINFRYIAQRGKHTVEGQTTSNLLSATYDWIIVDQLEDPEIQYKDFLDLMGRLRGSTPYKGDDETMPMSGPRMMLLTLNPTANWCYKKLVRPYHQYLHTGLVTPELIVDEDTLEPIIEVIEGSTYENKDNLDADFIKGLESTYKGQMRDRFLLGKWAAYEGLVYPQFTRETHMVSRKDIEKILLEADRTRSPYVNFEIFDFGIAVPMCYCMGFVDYYGRVFIVEGFYKTNGGDLDEVGRFILDTREKYEGWITFDNPIMSDPAIFKRTVVDGTGKGTTTIAKMLRDRFDLQLRPGQNDKSSGVVKVADYLNSRQGMHYRNEEEFGPMLYICDELTFAEDEFVAYFWKVDPTGERVDEPRDGNDHFMDGLKYGLSTLPAASELHYVKPVITPEFLRWHEAP